MKHCKQCGGALKFNPTRENLICTRCQKEYSFSKSKIIDYHSFSMEKYEAKLDKAISIKQMKCQNCGASFKNKNMSISSACSYCGSPLVAEFDDKNNSPDACLPYVISEQDVETKFKEEMKRKKFIPNKIKNIDLGGKIESVYVPAYLYSLDTNSEYAGRLYDVTTDSDGSSSRKYYKVSGKRHIVIDDIVFECSSQINQLTLDRIKPFNLNELKSFSEEFVMGYSVEYYDKSINETKKSLDSIVRDRVKKEVLKGYSCDGVDYLTINTNYISSKYCKILLPTYRINYNYGKKTYQTYINGQTGKVGGNVPRSKWKIGLFIAGILAGVVAIAGMLLLTMIAAFI